MKKKLFTLLTLLMAVCSGAWADDETIFKWQYDGSSTYGGSNGEFAITNTSGIGTVKFVTYEGKTTGADGTSNYNASVTDNDLKPSITKVCKLGNNGAHIKISPASGNFKAGDIIYICGYNPMLVTTSTDPTSTAKITTDTGDGGATTVIASSLATGTSKSSCAVGSITLPGGFSETDAIYISRVPTTSVGIAAIKVVRPDPSKKTSDLTLTSSSSVTLDPEETSQITYSTSSTGAFTYTSSASGVATVSSTGLITAVAYGTATITINQAADATYNAGSKTVTVNVNKVRKATEVTGEFILDTTNGSLDGKVYKSNDGSVMIECGTTGSGSNTNYDNKNSHYKSSGDCLFTLPTNYTVSTIQFVGYSNNTSDQTITLKEIDGVALDPTPSGTILKKEQIPATDCVGFEFDTPAEESILINISSECRGYFILNPAAKNITMTQVGTNYYASFYSAGEVTITGATAYTAELNGDKNKLILTECTGGVVGGRTGVILIGNSASATATPSFTGAAKGQGDLIGVAEKAVSMSSYYAGSASAADKVFVLGVENSKAGLYKYTGPSLGVNKAYLYDETLVNARSLSFDFADDITAINGVNVETVKSELKKFFENGKLVIEKNGAKYNAAGQQVK